MFLAPVRVSIHLNLVVHVESLRIACNIGIVISSGNATEFS